MWFKKNKTKNPECFDCSRVPTYYFIYRLFIYFFVMFVNRIMELEPKCTDITLKGTCKKKKKKKFHLELLN